MALSQVQAHPTASAEGSIVGPQAGALPAAAEKPARAASGGDKLLLGFSLAYILLGGFATVLGATGLVDHQLVASLTPRFKPFLQILLNNLDELFLPIASALSLTLLLGGSLLAVGGMLILILRGRPARAQAPGPSGGRS